MAATKPDSSSLSTVRSATEPAYPTVNLRTSLPIRQSVFSPGALATEHRFPLQERLLQSIASLSLQHIPTSQHMFSPRAIATEQRLPHMPGELDRKRVNLLFASDKKHLLHVHLQNQQTLLGNIYIYIYI